MEINMQLAWNYCVAFNELGLRNFIFTGCLFLLAHLQMFWVVPTMENEIEAWTVFSMALLSPAGDKALDVTRRTSK